MLLVDSGALPSYALVKEFVDLRPVVCVVKWEPIRISRRIAIVPHNCAAATWYTTSDHRSVSSSEMNHTGVVDAVITTEIPCREGNTQMLQKRCVIRA